MPPKASFVNPSSDTYLEYDDRKAYGGQTLEVPKGEKVRAITWLENLGESGTLSLWIKDETTGNWLGGFDMVVFSGHKSPFLVEFTPDWVGTHKIKFYACHKENGVPYIDEVLDMAFYLKVVSPPRFMVVDLWTEPSSFKVGEQVQFKATIKNIGDSGGYCQYEFSLNGWKFGIKSVYIGAGQSETVTTYYTFRDANVKTLSISANGSGMSMAVQAEKVYPKPTITRAYIEYGGKSISANQTLEVPAGSTLNARATVSNWNGGEGKVKLQVWDITRNKELSSKSTTMSKDGLWEADVPFTMPNQSIDVKLIVYYWDGSKWVKNHEVGC